MPHSAVPAADLMEFLCDFSNCLSKWLIRSSRHGVQLIKRLNRRMIRISFLHPGCPRIVDVHHINFGTFC
jgi:hypothetical protein